MIEDDKEILEQEQEKAIIQRFQHNPELYKIDDPQFQHIMWIITKTDDGEIWTLNPQYHDSNFGEK